jgi:hypothetical protein
MQQRQNAKGLRDNFRKEIDETRSYYKWVPVTTAWHVLRLQMDQWPPTWKAATNILNKKSQTAIKG